jgi:hypothetical protein
MQCIAFDSHKHYTWAFVQNETGKHSSLLPLPSSLPPTPRSFLRGPSPITLHPSPFTVCYPLTSSALSEMPPELPTPGGSGDGCQTETLPPRGCRGGSIKP